MSLLHIHKFDWPVRQNITLHFAKNNWPKDTGAVFIGNLMECSCRQLKFFPHDPEHKGLNPVEVTQEMVGDTE